MTIANTYSRSTFETQVSNYDRLTAWLMASIIVLGALFLVFATLLLREISTSRPPPPKPVPPTIPIIPGDIDADDLVDPGTEAPELQTEIIDLSLFETDVLSTARAQSALHWQGSNDALGDGEHRGIGPPDDPDPPKEPGAESQRWSLTYELSDIDTYTAQLRFFKIELGLASQNTNDIWRIADVGQQNRVSKSTRQKENNAAYFVTSNARMARWDKSFALESQVDSQGCDLNHVILVHFYPDAVVELLKALELDAIPLDMSIDQVRETNFRLVKTEDGFEFEVAKIKFE